MSLSGTTEHGNSVSNDNCVEQVHVVNLWYATCGPCIIETPRLDELWQSYQAESIGILG